MEQPPLSKTKIESKLAIIREAVSELRKLTGATDQTNFIKDKNQFAIAEHYLRRALEAVFDISGHVISRFPYSPGKRPNTLKDLAKALGEKNIVVKSFAEEQLTKMAGYRNRLVHFYDEINAEELFGIITADLKDLEEFAKAVVNLLEHPSDFGVSVEEL